MGQKKSLVLIRFEIVNFCVNYAIQVMRTQIKAPNIHQKGEKTTLNAIKRRQFWRHSADWSRGNSEARGGGGGYALEFLVGVCRPHLQIQTQFQSKKCHSPHPFSDLAWKIHTRFHTWPCTWLSIAYVSVLNGSQRNKDEYVKLSWNDIFYLFSSFSPVTRPGCWEEK